MQDRSEFTGRNVAPVIWVWMLWILGCAPQVPQTLPIHPAAPDSLELTELTELKPYLVRSGLEVFLTRDHSKDTLRYGLLTNQTAVNRDLKHAVDLLPALIDLQLVLSPEHGLYGAENAGDKVENESQPNAALRSVTTYGQKPAEIVRLIEDLDVIIFDIQDIGVRSYTYIYSMAYLMKAAALSAKKVIIFDRPNPINGIQMEGNLLDPAVASFVGLYPIPYRHGMTTGELALLFNTEFQIHCELEVVPMKGWQREMWFDETGLPWVPTSPHVPDAGTILPMISTGTYGELGTLSEGVGTTIPFEFSGGPWIQDAQEFAQALQARAGDGVVYRPAYVKPYYGRHLGQVCGGVQLHVTDRDIYEPYFAGLQLLAVHQELYPSINLFENRDRWSMFSKVVGSNHIQEAIQNQVDMEDLKESWQSELAKFSSLREQYLLYD